MKIILPLDENKKDMCIVLGRSPFFMLYNSDNKEATILDNPAANEDSGAGLKVSQFIVDSGANALITVRCGENASKVLKAANIEIYKSSADTAKENIELLLNNKLERLDHFHSGYHGIR